MELIYSDQVDGFEAGKAYANPRYFRTLNPRATSVVVIGDWPDVVAAYEAAGIPVNGGAIKEEQPKPAPDQAAEPFVLSPDAPPETAVETKQPKTKKGRAAAAP